ncbi:hypothetical protein EVAR_2354_1 [Eumeta japonica]|uniref:Uncharacterized protein n=1 Tax=Eumeta variegata TaxID=151549 RepID=A0A4C1SG50_EUMVA|nr:hypothetical protein EVAR_2354_1 [Eumeta japonica]
MICRRLGYDLLRAHFRRSCASGGPLGKGMLFYKIGRARSVPACRNGNHGTAAPGYQALLVNSWRRQGMLCEFDPVLSKGSAKACGALARSFNILHSSIELGRDFSGAQTDNLYQKLAQLGGRTAVFRAVLSPLVADGAGIERRREEGQFIATAIGNKRFTAIIYQYEQRNNYENENIMSSEHAFAALRPAERARGASKESRLGRCMGVACENPARLCIT